MTSTARTYHMSYLKSSIYVYPEESRFTIYPAAT